MKMMRFLVPVCLLMSVTLCLPGILGEETAAAKGCESLSNNGTLCCDNTDCAFYASCKNETQLCLNASVTEAVLKEKCGVDNATDTCAHATPDTCKNLKENDCCNTTGCQFLTCKSATNASQILSGCYNETATVDLTCSKGSKINTCEAVVQGSVGGIGADEDVCSSQGVNMSSCCGVNGCAWYNCTVLVDGKLKQGCINETQLDNSSLCGGGQIANNSCETPNPTTTPATPTVVCTDKTTADDCCKEKSECSWINCTAVDESQTVTQCLKKADIDTKCKKGTAVDTCEIPVIKTTTTTTSTTTTTHASPSSSGPRQHFDGASFVGGMILAFGIVALIFFGCKCYKARKERNYHTL